MGSLGDEPETLCTGCVVFNRPGVGSPGDAPETLCTGCVVSKSSSDWPPGSEVVTEPGSCEVPRGAPVDDEMKSAALGTVLGTSPSLSDEEVVSTCVLFKAPTDVPLNVEFTYKPSVPSETVGTRAALEPDTGL